LWVVPSARRPCWWWGQIRTGDLPLAKPDRAGSLPAERVNGAGRGRPGAVRGCPLGTGRDCCKWHGSGTTDEDDVPRAWRRRNQLDRRVRPDPGDACLVAKGPSGPAAADGWDSNPLPRRFNRRGYRGEGAVACGFFLPAVTARVQPEPAVPDAMRTQRGPGGPAPQRGPYSPA
jgi:hypothetical protein